MTTVVSVRVNEEERALLEAASTLAAISLSDSIRLKAREAAEAGILDQPTSSISGSSPSRPRTGRRSRRGRAVRRKRLPGSGTSRAWRQRGGSNATASAF